MSAQPDSDLINIEINGQPYQARKGQMLIEITDAAGITVPRFCYHKKLPIAANCRMCLVEVERAPKPLPACATPVMDGMKVYTQSPKALEAQRGVMEFLLINHPLDCPICDQGGECELQDVALGFGRGVSRFTERKRVVKDKNVGPLIATDLTRCIHCTRCIRFLDVIAGNKELGATGRGENMTIGTYIERAIDSELSGNVIDVCPVGALTSKPFRFTARAWEMTERTGIAAHDALGSHIAAHLRGSRIMRVVPRECEALNEVWLSDRDRFAYQGLNAAQRLTTPMIKVNDAWRECDWETALDAAVKGLKKVLDGQGADQLAALAAGNATTEELYLLQKLIRALGSPHVDHRLRDADVSDQDLLPAAPALGMPFAELEQVDAALLVGSQVRAEIPLVAHRLRKAALKGAKVSFVNPRDFDLNFPVAHQVAAAPHNLPRELAGIAKAAGANLPAELATLCPDTPSVAQQAIANELKAVGRATVVLGHLAQHSAQAALLRALAQIIATATGAVFGCLPAAANSAGAWLAGAVPHRLPGGKPADQAGEPARKLLEQPKQAYVLLGVEPEYDALDAGGALQTLQGAGCVVALTAYVSDVMKSYANVLLPIAPYSETSGTFVNLQGDWQSVAAITKAQGEARPGWKVLRVLGNLLGVAGFDYTSSEDVRDELRAACAGVTGNTYSVVYRAPAQATPVEGLVRVAGVAPYSGDAVLRRAEALQQTALGDGNYVAINSAEAQRHGVAGRGSVVVKQGARSVELPLRIDDAVPDGVAWLPAATEASARLGNACGGVTLTVGGAA